MSVELHQGYCVVLDQYNEMDLAVDCQIPLSPQQPENPEHEAGEIPTESGSDALALVPSIGGYEATSPDLETSSGGHKKKSTRGKAGDSLWDTSARGARRQRNRPCKHG